MCKVVKIELDISECLTIMKGIRVAVNFAKNHRCNVVTEFREIPLEITPDDTEEQVLCKYEDGLRKTQQSLKQEIDNYEPEELYDWPLDKNVMDFHIVAEGLEFERQISRANAVRYLIERCKLAEGKLERKV